MTAMDYEVLEGATREDAHAVNVSIKRGPDVRGMHFYWRVISPQILGGLGLTIVTPNPKWSRWTEPEPVKFDDFGFGNLKLDYPGPVQFLITVHYHDNRPIQTQHVWFLRGGRLWDPLQGD